jgi:hypothetical protein
MSQSRDPRQGKELDKTDPPDPPGNPKSQENNSGGTYASIASDLSGPALTPKTIPKSNSEKSSTMLENLTMNPRIKKATPPSTTEERENEQLEQEKCFKNGIIRLTCRMSTITAVDVAAAILEETKHWPTRITCRHNRAKKLCTFEVLVGPELAKEMALRPLFIKRQKMMVDDCSMDPSHEFEVRGCSASYTNEEILRLIQQRVGPNATVSGFSSILV